MNEVLNEIVALLDKSGTIRKPKAEGAKGLLVFNPTNLDFASIEQLAAKVEGLSAINTPQQTFHNNKPVPPHVWVGPARPGVTITDGVSALANELGL